MMLKRLQIAKIAGKIAIWIILVAHQPALSRTLKDSQGFKGYVPGLQLLLWGADEAPQCPPTRTKHAVHTTLTMMMLFWKVVSLCRVVVLSW